MIYPVNIVQYDTNKWVYYVKLPNRKTYQYSIAVPEYVTKTGVEDLVTRDIIVNGQLVPPTYQLSFTGVPTATAVITLN